MSSSIMSFKGIRNDDTVVSMSCPASPNSVRLKFIDDADEIHNLTAENAANQRQCLYTDIQRIQMSNDLLRSVSHRDPGQTFLRLEKTSRHVPKDMFFSKFEGPLGVLRFPADTPLSPGSPDTPTELEIPTPDESIPTPSSWIDDAPISSPITPKELDTDFPPQPSGPLEPSDLLIPQDTDLIQTTLDPLTPALSLPSDQPESWILLSHYKEQIVRLISPLGNAQSTPWISLVMPCAMSTLAELTMGETPTQARLALLNALLATSAFHIEGSSLSTKKGWMRLGDEYVQQAQQHLKQCMADYVGKQGKYKEILMATLSLANAFMVKGDPDTRLTYLVASERFIRSHGFKQPTLSAKRRALHHCYAYMRIMAETTCLSDTTNIHTDTDDTGDTPEQSLGFRLSPWISITDDTMATAKDPQMAQRDLHLAIPGHWESTLFPELHGVTETFLMLLSQVIRLANERDRTLRLQPGVKPGLSLQEFTIRANVLEKRIRMLILPPPLYPTLDSSTGCSATIQVMYTALLIFLHRRVYDLDATLLQQEVQAVQHYLTQIRREDATRRDGGMVVLIWPAFIAACEALLPESQLFFTLWFDFTFKATGLVAVSLAQKVSEVIWARRNQSSSNGGCSWPDLLRDKQLKFMCT